MMQSLYGPSRGIAFVRQGYLCILHTGTVYSVHTETVDRGVDEIAGLGSARREGRLGLQDVCS